MTVLGIISVVCGALASVLWIPSRWVNWLPIVSIAFGIVGVVLGYFSAKQYKDRIPYMQQQAAAYGQPFRPPFNWGEFGLVLSGVGLAVNVLLFSYSFSAYSASNGRIF